MFVSAASAQVAAVTDYTNYNTGSQVSVRLSPADQAIASIRYAGEEQAVSQSIPIGKVTYEPLWLIPWEARTGRYEIDLKFAGGKIRRNAASFAVHRQFAKVLSVDLDKTFYTSGDEVSPRIVVRNISNQPLTNLRVEFESYTYPWIAAPADEPPAWKTIVADALALPAGAEREFTSHGAAVVRADKDPVVIYFAVVIRDTTHPERIYDLAFAPPAFTVPPNQPLPKQYPFLYLYPHLTDFSKAEAYRHFYPARFVSDAIRFDAAHTMFPTGAAPVFAYTVTLPERTPAQGLELKIRVMSADGKEQESKTVAGSVPGHHELAIEALPEGLYTLEAQVRDAEGLAIAENRLEFAVNQLPKSILIFCAHQDDDTAHPGLIRAAVENHIPIQVVYFTSGDAGGCDRYYMHSCDAARAMDFGEVRMEEARASLGHLGVARENIFFLGLPDGGLERIWYEHAHADNPYLSVLLASDHSPYREAATPNLPFARDSAVNAVKAYIARFQPDLIVTGHPDERHVDHRVNNWMVVSAMQDLLKQGRLSRDTKLLVDVSYGPLPGRHAPYVFDKDVFHVSGEAAMLGQEATWYYQSQDGNHEQAVLVDFDKLPRTEAFPHYWIQDWWAHEGWNASPPVQ
jgi:LmbE family N-acetylglucosaminyl deacetylase